MRSFATALLVAGALVSQTTATIYVTEPTASTICTAGTACNVRWNDDANVPALATIGPCNIELYTGGVQQQTFLQTIAAGWDVSQYAVATYLPDATVGPNSSMYFVKFTSLTYKDPANPTFPFTAYSAKFTLNGMTGTFNSTVQAQIDGVASSAAAVSTPAAAAGTTTTPAAAAKTTAVASAAKSAAASASATHANGAISATAPGVVSSTIGFGMVMSFASFFLGALAFGL
ncbi:hypothetical protein FRC04_007976 [Tulasnella sp. 424]|nr:hypothetical protein FRC04_007976 [Tulasnella sp. 424]KAG8974836.1 hypothetical protein FRC05_006769 [Tulasnella sp. 425]